MSPITMMTMKISAKKRHAAGFSMIELMTVIAIMVILAGLLIAALPGIQSKINRGRVERMMAEFADGLSKYQLDHGIYPQNPPNRGERDTVGIEGASVLYKHLSGDWNEDGEVDFDTDEKVYVSKLSFKENQESKDPRVGVSGDGKFVVLDAYGNEFRYLAQPPNIDPEERETFNPTYDLWSIVDADPTAEEDQARHITNWQSN